MSQNKQSINSLFQTFTNDINSIVNTRPPVNTLVRPPLITSINSVYESDNKLIFNIDASINSRLAVNGDVSMNADVAIDGGVAIAGDVFINSRLFLPLNSLYINNQILGELNKITTFDDISINQRLSVGLKSTFNGEVVHNNNTYFYKDIYLSGNEHIIGNVTVNDISMTGNLLLGGTFSTNQTINATGLVIGNPTTDPSDNITILDVSATTHFRNTVYPIQLVDHSVLLTADLPLDISNCLGLYWYQTPQTMFSGMPFKKTTVSANGQVQAAIVDAGAIYLSYNYGANWFGPDFNNIIFNNNYRITTYYNGLYNPTYTINLKNRSHYEMNGIVSLAMSSDGQIQTALLIDRDISFNSGIYLSNDSGENWQQIIGKTEIGDLSYVDVTVSATGKYQTVIANGPNFFASNTYGNQWTPVEFPVPYVDSSYNVYFDGSDNNMFDTPNNNYFDISNNTLYWNAVGMSSSGQYQTIIMSPGFIYNSDDFGKTWIINYSIGDNWTSVAISATGQYQVVTSDISNSSIVMSYDYGNSWTKITSFPSTQFTSVTISASGKNIVASAYRGIIYTSDSYGSSWTKIVPNNISDNSYSSVAISANSQYLTLLSQAGNIYYSITPNVNLSASNNLIIYGDSLLNNRLVVSGDVSFNNRLFAKGDTVLNRRLFVGGDVSFNNRLNIGSDVTIGKRLFVNVGSFIVGDSVFSISNIASDASINGLLSVYGDVSLCNRLFVNGDVSLNSQLTVYSDVSMNNRLFVSSDASFGGNMFVALDTIIGGDVAIDGDVAINNRVFIGNDLSVNKHLFVNNDVSFNGNLSVAKTITCTDLIINNTGTDISGGAFIAKVITASGGLVSLSDVSLNQRLSIDGDAVFNGNNIFNGPNVFNNFLPTSSVTPSSSDQLVTKTYVDNIVSSSVSSGTTTLTSSNTSFYADVSVYNRLFVNGDVSLNSRLTVTRDASFNNRLFVGGDLSVNKHLFVSGDTSLNANVTVGKDLLVLGRLSVNQYTQKNIISTTTTNYTLIVSEDLSLNNCLLVNGDVSLNQRLFVGGDVSLNSRLRVGSDVTLGGRLFINNDSFIVGGSAFSISNIASDASINSRLTVYSDVSLNQLLFVGSDTSLNGNLFANGDVSLNSRLNVGSDVTMGGRLFINNDSFVVGGSAFSISNIASDASINSRLVVYGDVSFGQQLNVGSDVTLGGRLFINNNSFVVGGAAFSISNIASDASINSRLVVYGDVSFNNRLFVGGDLSLNKRLLVGGDCSFNGNVTFTNYLPTSSIIATRGSQLVNKAYVDSVAGGSSSNITNTNTTFNQNLYISGDVSANNRLFVGGDASFNGNVTFTNFLPTSIIGPSLASHLVTKSYVDTAILSSGGGGGGGGGQIVLNGASTFTNDVSMNARLFVGRDASVNGNLFANVITCNELIVTNSDNNGGFTFFDLVTASGFISTNDVSLNTRLFVGGDVSMNSRLLVGSDVTLGGRLFINNNSLLVGGAAFSISNIASDASINGRLIVYNDVSLNNRLFVGGDVSLNNRLFVDGDVSMNSRLLVGSDVTLGGRLFINNNALLVGGSAFSISNIASDASINGRLIVYSDVSLNNRLFVSGDLSINQRLFVSGDVSLNGNVVIAKDTLILGRLMVQQYSQQSIINTTTNNYTLIVSEDLSLNNRLMVNGDVSMNNRLTVYNDVSFNSRLFVGGDVSMNNRLFVNNDVSFNGNLTVANVITCTELIINNTDTKGGVFFAEVITASGGLVSLVDVSINQRLSVGSAVASGNNIMAIQQGTGSYSLVTSNLVDPFYINSPSITMGMGVDTTNMGAYINCGSGGTNANKLFLLPKGGTVYMGSSNTVVTSDIRIKKNIQPLDNTDALNLVRKLNPCTFEYIDENFDRSKHIGFIAQEVNQLDLLRFAVDTSGIRFIPNIYCAASYDTSEQKVTLDKALDDQLIVGDMVELAIQHENDQGDQHNYLRFTVSSVLSPTEFTIDPPVDGATNGTKLFVFGKKVDDFLGLKKDMIFTVALSAVQKLDALVAKQQAQIDLLIQQNELLVEQITKLSRANI